MKLKQLVESPENEQRVKAAGWIPVKVGLTRLDQDDDPTGFGPEPAMEVPALLYISPRENKVYTRSKFDDEVRGHLERDADGIVFVVSGARHSIRYDKKDLNVLTYHL